MFILLRRQEIFFLSSKSFTTEREGNKDGDEVALSGPDEMGTGGWLRISNSPSDEERWHSRSNTKTNREYGDEDSARYAQQVYKLLLETGTLATPRVEFNDQRQHSLLEAREIPITTFPKQAPKPSPFVCYLHFLFFPFNRSFSRQTNNNNNNNKMPKR